MTAGEVRGSGALLSEVRELLLAADDIIRTEWELGDSRESGGDVSRGTASAAALDRVTQLGAALIDRQQHEALGVVVDTLARLYREAETSGATPPERYVTDLTCAVRRRDVALRVYVLGALATYQSWFVPLRDFVLQQPDPRGASRLWLRDTVTLLSRANEFDPKSIIPLVADYLGDHPVLFRRFRNSQSDAVNALCQFDFLQCVVSTEATKDIHECYPNFGAYYNDRAEPVVKSLVTRGPARTTIPDLDDESLANIIRELDELAGHLFFSVAGWSQGAWRSAEVRDFLARHASRSP